MSAISPPGALPDNPTPADVVRWIVAAPDRPAQAKRLGAAAAAYHKSREVLTVFNRLAAAKDGHRLALQFAARMPQPMPTGLILLSAPLLQSRDVSVQLRINVAGRLVATMPDRPESIGPIVRALTAGLGKVRTLERLIHLQSRVPKSETLDRIVDDAEAKTRLKCPKCSARLTRPALIKHLWAKHRLVYEDGGAREPGPLVERAVQQFVESREPDDLDRVYAVTEQLYADAEPRQIHQAILSRLGRDHEDAELLCRAAAEDGRGLCPSCYSMLPPSIPPTPDALALGNGRLVGVGYRLETLRRKIEITYPDNSVERIADPNGRPGSREFAAQVGAAIAGLGLLTAAVFPAGNTKPLVPTLAISFLSVAAYTGLLYRERRVPKPEVRALDAAWREIAPHVGRSPTAIRYLARLCRTSLGRGTTDERSKTLWELVEHAAVLAEKGAPQTQLLAAARVLQAHDSARIGKEWVNQLLGVCEPFFRDEVSPVYAEAAADILLASDYVSDRDAARLRVQLPATAFDAGLTPAGLNAIAEACPNFGRLLAGNVDWFELLYELWRMRTSRPWESAVGAATSVLDLTKKGNSTIRSLLAFPDTLLVAELDAPFDKELGEVLIGRRGVTIGDLTVSDADAGVATETTRKGTNVLAFGPHRIATERKIPEKTLRVLRGWLRFRTDRLMSAGGRYAAEAVPERVQQMLAPLAVACPMCGTQSVVKVGEIGKPAGAGS